MKHFLATSTSASALLLCASAAMADVTADQVWTAWQTMGKTGGNSYTVGKEEKGPGTVTVTDLAIKNTNGSTDVTGTLPKMTFTEQGDGTVAVTTSDTYKLDVKTKGKDDHQFTNTVTMTQSGQKLIVSGTPETMSYDYKADTLDVAVGDFTRDGTPYDLQIDATLKAPSVGYVMKPGEKLDLATTLAVSSVDFKAKGTKYSELTGSASDDTGSGDDVDNDGSDTDGADQSDSAPATPVDSPEAFDLTGTITGIAGASTSTMDGKADGSSDFSKMLAAGFMTQGSFTYDGSTIDGSMVDEGGAKMSYLVKNGAGKLDLAIDADRIVYDVSSDNTSVELKSADFPVPDMSFALVESKIALLLPIAKSETPKPFALNFTMRGLTVSDAIWNLFDPKSTIARTPANVVLDVTGTATPKESLANPGGAEALSSGEASPADLNTLEIADLEVTAGGASLKGTGEVAFDYSKPKVLGGELPMPVGTVNLTLDGANDLLGKLMTLGAIDPQVMMGFGMVTSMIAKPGATPDSLVSKIEFTDDGKILANGNPLPIGPQ